MYRRRPTLLTFNYLKSLTKVCSRQSNKFHFCRNLSTALESQDYFNSINESNIEKGTNNFQQNQHGYVNRNLGTSEQNGNRVYGQNLDNQFQNNEDCNFSFANIENGTNSLQKSQHGYVNGNLSRSEENSNRVYGQNLDNKVQYNQDCNFSPGNIENATNSLQKSQHGYVHGNLGRSEENGNRVYGQTLDNRFQHNQDCNFASGYIENGSRNVFLENPNEKKGRLSFGYVDHNQKNGNFGVYDGLNGKDTGRQNGYERKRGYGGDFQQNGYGYNYGQGGFVPSRNGSEVYGEVNGGISQRSNGVYSGGNDGNLQQRQDGGNYAGSYGNSQHSGVKPQDLQQNGYSGGDSGNLQKSWNAGYSGENSENSQQSWNADNSAWNSGNSQNLHPSRNWNEHCSQNLGMHQETSHVNYAGNGGTLQFQQGNHNAENMGIYHGNTGFSNNHSNVKEYQQIAGGGHQSYAGFVQQTSNQCESGYVGNGGESSVEPNDESEVVAEDQLKATIEELDKCYDERKLKEAVDVLGVLEGQHISVDLPRYLLLFKACGEEKALEEGKSIHKHLLRSGLHLEAKIHNKILEMYCSCGSLDDAFEVFDKMPRRNLTTWDTMISSLAKNGRGEDSILMFTQFKETGLRPDGRMFLGIFSACGVLGDTIEGLLHFESMKKEYFIVPSMEHYISVVDMLGTAGNLDEALEFINKMPLEPSVEIWEVLMNLCRMHGNLELGDRCAELVEVLDPSRLDEQSRAGYLPMKPFDAAKNKEKNESAQSFPIGGNRLEYRAGDRSQPELYDLLKGMREQLKEAGYFPELKVVLHDIDPEGKEEAVMAHSERLAVAQALLSSPARSSLRIIKNLRICVDCHNTMKIISKLVGRELIIRDAKRFHHFKDGSCSCREYW